MTFHSLEDVFCRICDDLGMELETPTYGFNQYHRAQGAQILLNYAQAITGKKRSTSLQQVLYYDAILAKSPEMIPIKERLSRNGRLAYRLDIDTDYPREERQSFLSHYTRDMYRRFIKDKSCEETIAVCSPEEDQPNVCLIYVPAASRCISRRMWDLESDSACYRPLRMADDLLADLNRGRVTLAQMTEKQYGLLREIVNHYIYTNS